MRINTKTKTVELMKVERDRLVQAHDVVILLAKHSEGEIAKAAAEACKALGNLMATINANPANKPKT